MDIYKEIITIVTLATCVLIPYIGIMTAIGIIATKAKWKSAQETLRNIETGKYKDDQKVRNKTTVYIIVSLFAISLLCVAILFLASSTFLFI